MVSVFFNKREWKLLIAAGFDWAGWGVQGVELRFDTRKSTITIVIVRICEIGLNAGDERVFCCIKTAGNG